MKKRHDVTEQVFRWIDKADHDLLAAEHIMTLEGSELTDIICFHCQQCAEKYVKALLVSVGVHFPKTHDLRLLLDLAPMRVLPDLSRPSIIALNRYVIEGRYPGDWEPITLEEAQEALATANEVRAAIRAILPKEMLKPD